NTDAMAAVPSNDRTNLLRVADFDIHVTRFAGYSTLCSPSAGSAEGAEGGADGEAAGALSTTRAGTAATVTRPGPTTTPCTTRFDWMFMTLTVSPSAPASCA